EVVNHSMDEYVRGDAHTNTIESVFSLLKRGITGTFHHVSQQHLHRYLAEFDFRYNNRSALGVEDQPRAERASRGIVGKRLTYRSADYVYGQAEGAGGASRVHGVPGWPRWLPGQRLIAFLHWQDTAASDCSR